MTISLSDFVMDGLEHNRQGLKTHPPHVTNSVTDANFKVFAKAAPRQFDRWP